MTRLFYSLEHCSNSPRHAPRPHQMRRPGNGGGTSTPRPSKQTVAERARRGSARSPLATRWAPNVLASPRSRERCGRRRQRQCVEDVVAPRKLATCLPRNKAVPAAVRKALRRLNTGQGHDGGTDTGTLKQAWTAKRLIPRLTRAAR